MKYPILEQAVNSSLSASLVPTPSAVVETLLTAEKQARKDKINYSLENLIGSWQLRFITGTKKTRQKAGKVLGAGKYIPRFIQINLEYYRPDSQFTEEVRVQNSVKFGLFTLSLTGPVKFLAPKNILVFDFTTITIRFLGIKLYDGYIRGGKEKEDTFATEKLSQQAFFVYFLIQNKFIAARGRGGGLALWSKS
ncbi:MAG: hypothetical protein ACFCU5_13535 [Pleurocapsa sp.]